MATRTTPRPPSVNFHLWKSCNMRCRFCFATFHDTKVVVPKGHLAEADAVAVVQKLAEAGFRKLTFAGGEPTLCPWLETLVRTARRAGMTTMLVTNGSKLDGLDWVFDPNGPLDWVTLSIDSANPDTHAKLGRAAKGVPMTNAQYRAIAGRLRKAGVRVKLNTVVTGLNGDEDMSALVEAMQPERWKMLRMLPVAGQNDGSEDLLVDAERFAGFVARHGWLELAGVELVPEDHKDIRGTYAMVDPGGRFFDDTEGGHTYSRPILEAGVEAAWEEVCFRPEGFVERKGRYDWAAPIVPASRLARSRAPQRKAPLLIGLVATSGAGKDTVGGMLGEHAYQRVALADGLKVEVQRLFELEDEQLWGEGRNVQVERLGWTPRVLYQRFSDACRELDPQVWLRPWKRELERRVDAGERVV